MLIPVLMRRVGIGMVIRPILGRRNGGPDDQVEEMEL